MSIKIVEQTASYAKGYATLSAAGLLIAEAQTANAKNGNWTSVTLEAVNQDTGALSSKSSGQVDAAKARIELYLQGGVYKVVACSQNHAADSESVSLFIQ